MARAHRGARGGVGRAQRPITAKSQPPEARTRTSRNGGAVSHARKGQSTPAERWQAEKGRAIELLKRDLAELYGDGSDAETPALAPEGDADGLTGRSTVPDTQDGHK